MGFLEGFIGGIGQSAQQASQNMLNARMSKYKALAEVYKGIYSNPDIRDDNVREEALRRWTALSGANAMDKSTTQGLDKFANMKDIIDAHQNSSVGQAGGKSQPSLQFRAQAAPAPAQAAPQPAPQPAPQQQQLPQAPSMMVPFHPVNTSQSQQQVPQQAPQQHQMAGPMEAIRPQLETQLANMGLPGHLDSIAEEVDKEVGPDPDAGRMFRSDAGKQWMATKSEIAKEIIKRRMMAKQMESLFATEGSGVPSGSEADSEIRQQWKVDATLGKALTRFQQSSINGHPAQFLPSTGHYFINGAPVDMQAATRGGRGQWIRGYTRDNPTPRMIWALPGEEKTIFPATTATSRTTSQDPNALTTTSQSQTSFVGGNGGGIVSGGGGGLPPAPGNTTTPSTSPAVTKAHLGQTAIRKLDNDIKALKVVGAIDTELEDPRTLTGPVVGRAAAILNEMGWGEGINKLAALIDAKAASGQNAGAETEQYFAQLEVNLPEAVRKAVAEKGGSPADASSAAVHTSRVITYMRMLNGMELVSMSGSGNGITRLYMMMKSAMANPSQSREIIKGHLDALTGLFSSGIASNYEGRNMGWKDLTPAQRKVLQYHGAHIMFEDFAGEQTPFSQSPVGKVQAGPDKGKSLYKHKDGKNYTFPETP